MAAAVSSFYRLIPSTSCALAQQQPEIVAGAEHALLIPDYFSFRLTGNLNWEYTNATTTQLVNIDSDNWDATLLNWAGVPASWFGTPTHPGNVIGHWQNPQGTAVPVVAVASHDTASAVIASPLKNANAAYLSSGTWSLMGFESTTPYTSTMRWPPISPTKVARKAAIAY
jgi:rhamnulokinase